MRSNSACRSVMVLGRQRLDADRFEPAPDLGIVEKAELNTAHGGMEGRQAAPHRRRHRHDPLGRHARHIDDLDPLQDRGRTGFAHALAQVLHQRNGAVDPALGGEIGKAELQDVGRERKLAAVLFDIAELGQRAQNSPRGRARHAGGERRLRQRHGRPLPAETTEHGESLGERRHELLVVGAG